tara:strand:- start:601 stop:759 length:159 start_codon:yes stop_codon:yes gene_type:complete
LQGAKIDTYNLYLTFRISKKYNNLTIDLSQWTLKQEEIYSLNQSFLVFEKSL